MTYIIRNIFGYFFILQAIKRSHCEWDERRDKVIYPKYYKYLLDRTEAASRSLYSYTQEFDPPKIQKRIIEEILCNFLVRMLNYFQKNISFFMKTWKKWNQKLLIIGLNFFQYCPVLPIWPKIENPYRKLGWDTLCSIYFVL